MKPVLIMLGIFLWIQAGSLDAGRASESEAAKVLDEYMQAFNALDIEGTAATLHYPNVRIAGGTVTVWKSREEYAASYSAAVVDQFVKYTGWHHSEWNRHEVVHSSADKVHFDVQFTRYRSDGSVIGVYDSLWVITWEGGHWGIKARSSFAD